MSSTNSTTKNRTFQHFSPHQRGQIQALLSQNVPKAQIARQVGIARSMLYLELQCGTVTQMRSDRKYFSQTGQIVYKRHREACVKLYKLNKAEEFISHLERAVIKEKLSVDAVYGRVKQEGTFSVTVCTKTIYNYIDAGIINIRNIDLSLKLRRNTHKPRCRVNPQTARHQH